MPQILVKEIARKHIPHPPLPFPQYLKSKVQSQKSKIKNPLPDHTQLPDKDDTFVQNFQEHPQSIILTDSILSKLQELHADGQFAIGQDSGIYWRWPIAEPTEPLYKGAKAPDWFYVPNVPPMLDEQFRRSYVLWQEHVPPLIALEFVSGDGSEERDKTPNKGKFWVYEQGIKIPYYAIYESNPARIEMYHLVKGKYELMKPNAQGHYEIPEMEVELGIWSGQYGNMTASWMRWWDKDGTLLPTNEEAKKQERLAKEQERFAKEQERFAKERERFAKEREQQAKELALQQVVQERQAKELEQQAKELALHQVAQERQAKERLAAKLRELGIDPTTIV